MANVSHKYNFQDKNLFRIGSTQPIARRSSINKIKEGNIFAATNFIWKKLSTQDMVVIAAVCILQKPKQLLHSFHPALNVSHQDYISKAFNEQGYNFFLN